MHYIIKCIKESVGHLERGKPQNIIFGAPDILKCLHIITVNPIKWIVPTLFWDSIFTMMMGTYDKLAIYKLLKDTVKNWKLFTWHRKGCARISSKWKVLAKWTEENLIIQYIIVQNQDGQNNNFWWRLYSPS